MTDVDLEEVLRIGEQKAGVVVEDRRLETPRVVGFTFTNGGRQPIVAADFDPFTPIAIQLHTGRVVLAGVRGAAAPSIAYGDGPNRGLVKLAPFVLNGG